MTITFGTAHAGPGTLVVTVVTERCGRRRAVRAVTETGANGTCPASSDQPGRRQHVQVLRDGLPGERKVVLHRKPGANLEQRLAVPLAQGVEDRPPCRGHQCLEHVGHVPMIGKWRLACQRASTSHPSAWHKDDSEPPASGSRQPAGAPKQSANREMFGRFCLPSVVPMLSLRPSPPRRIESTPDSRWRVT